MWPHEDWMTDLFGALASVLVMCGLLAMLVWVTPKRWDQRAD